MTTATMTSRLPGAKRSEGLGAWVRRTFKRLIAAREREARRRVALHLRGMDDEMLQSLGVDPHTIAALRREKIDGLSV